MDDLRKGQRAFNALYDLFPDVANKLRGGSVDPFYWDDKKWEREQDRFWGEVSKYGGDPSRVKNSLYL